MDRMAEYESVDVSSILAKATMLTKDEIDFIKDYYDVTTYSVIAKKLNKHISTIAHHCKRLGLKKTKNANNKKHITYHLILHTIDMVYAERIVCGERTRKKVINEFISQSRNLKKDFFIDIKPKNF